MRNFIALLFGAALLVAATIPATAPGDPSPAPVLPEVAEGFELVGHSPLGDRGMNAALAVVGDADVAYVGSRTDGKPLEENALGAGIVIVDIADPSAPTVLGEVEGTGREGETSREMRVWHEQDLLIVQNLTSNCSPLIHACSVRGPGDHFAFYDIAGDNARDPQLLGRYSTTNNPHEFFLWIDPEDRDHALLYVSGTSSNRFIVVDISDVRDGGFREILDMTVPARTGELHSMTPTVDGRTTYFAQLTGGFYVADTSQLVDRVEDPEVTLVTTKSKAPRWEGPGAHSALEVPGTDIALVTDEVYGEALRYLGGHGCPWGWVRMIDVADPVAPQVVGEYKLPQNEASFCDTDAPRMSSSYSAHNPTVTEDLAFISWHAGGLQALDLSDPRNPTSAGQYVPSPLPFVLQEDPALTAGQDKIAMWSFPVISDGLVYVVDIRNGLYVLRYTGPRAERIADLDFLEGNSNLGDALEIAADVASGDGSTTD